MNKHIKIIATQAIFLVIILAALYIIYPRANAVVNGNFVKFNSINANVVIISNNPDFSNPRYIEIGKNKSITYDLNPGTYYWKSDNGIIQGLKNKFTIESEVGLGIQKNENDSGLVNIGNVKINVTKSKEGVMVGHIILSPDDSEKIENNGQYTGRQTE